MNFVMRTVRDMELIVSWVMRKYVKFLVLGALSSCAFLNLALHAGAGLHYYCQDECLKTILKAPLKAMDRDSILHIRNHWVDPPAPRGTYKSSFPMDDPPWGTMGNWGEALKFVNNYFKEYKVPGTFVEIGAKDGEFMSLTLFLEQKLGFIGLLVEPNPADYLKLRAAGRSSYSINACATPDGRHRKDLLWVRETPNNLPEVLRRVQEGSNRLEKYVSVEDRELGNLVEVQCFNSAAMVIAALQTVTVDLLIISTHGGELDILTSIPTFVKFRMVVMMVPLVSEEEYDFLKHLSEKRGLEQVFRKYNIHIFIPKAEVRIV